MVRCEPSPKKAEAVTDEAPVIVPAEPVRVMLEPLIVRLPEGEMPTWFENVSGPLHVCGELKTSALSLALVTFPLRILTVVTASAASLVVSTEPICRFWPLIFVRPEPSPKKAEAVTEEAVVMVPPGPFSVSGML